MSVTLSHAGIFDGGFQSSQRWSHRSSGSWRWGGWCVCVCGGTWARVVRETGRPRFKKSVVSVQRLGGGDHPKTSLSSLGEGGLDWGLAKRRQPCVRKRGRAGGGGGQSVGYLAPRHRGVDRAKGKVFGLRNKKRGCDRAGGREGDQRTGKCDDA